MENSNNKNTEAEIDLLVIFLELWKNKILISAITLGFAIVSIFVALSIPNFYTSKALLAPTHQDKTLSSQLGNLSNIASIAGVGLPNNETSKSEEALERIKSYDFFTTHFLPYIELENLVAISSWDNKKNIINYDSSIYSPESNKWQKKYSNLQSYKQYSEILGIIVDDKTGFITISISHMSPYISKKWVSIIVKNINESMRELDIAKAKRSIDFLNESSKTTTVQSIRDVISRLLESQMQTLMLASAGEAYIFKLIDSPIVPEDKSSPDRALICIFGTFIGLIASFAVVFIRNYNTHGR